MTVLPCSQSPGEGQGLLPKSRQRQLHPPLMLENRTKNGTGSKERYSHMFHGGSAASSPHFTQMPALILPTVTASNGFFPHQKKAFIPWGTYTTYDIPNILKYFCPLLCKNNRPSSEPFLCSIQLSQQGAAFSNRSFPRLTFLMYRRNVHTPVRLLNICRIKLHYFKQFQGNCDCPSK